MITTSSKLWFALAGLAAAAAVVYGVASDAEKLGTYVLVFTSGAALVLALVSQKARDGDVAATTTETTIAEAAAATTPAPPAVWPAVAAFGVAVTMIGLAAGGAMLWIGVAVLAAVLVEWTVQAWSERATGDRAYNRNLRNQIMYPFEIPVIGGVVIAVVVLGFSRVLLALPKTGSTVVAIAVAAVVLTIGALIATRPRISSSVVSVVVTLGAVAVIAGGIIGAVVGERDFEHHESGEHGEQVESDEGGGGSDTTENEGEIEPDVGSETGGEGE